MLRDAHMCQLMPSARFLPKAFTPTDEQVAIQTSGADSVLVQANAGAAKTTTLALCIAQALHEGLAPQRIQVLTYTAPACQAMQAALAQVGLPAPARKALAVHTFDDFAQRQLRSIEGQPVPMKTSHEALAPVVRQAMADCGWGDGDSGAVERFLATARRLKGTLARDRARWDGVALDDDWALDQRVEPGQLRLFSAYEALRWPQRDGVDRPRFRAPFDATYDLACLLADPEPTTLLSEIAAWPRQLGLLLVDEMHDLNLAMFTVLRGLLDQHATRFVGVGDFDQVIHEVAGAERRFMAADVDLGGRRVRIFPLTASHRFGRTLAALSGRLAAKPYASAAGLRTAVVCQAYADPPQAAGVADSADPARATPSAEQRLLAALAGWQTAHRGDLSQVAILLRHAWQSVAVENALLDAGIDYQCVGFTPYVLQPEVLLVRALLAIASDDYAPLQAASTRAELVRAVVFFCAITLDHERSPDETPDERLDNAIRHVAAQPENLRPFMEYQVLAKAEPALARRMNAAIAIARDQRCGRRADPGSALPPDTPWFDDFVAALDLPAWVRRVFIERQRRADALAYVDGLRRAARQSSGAQAFFDRLGAHETRLKATPSGLKRALRASQSRKRRLTLATIADVKGLEFDHVLLPYLEQGVFPSALAASLGEERNLCYVAITRARQQLTLLAHARRPSAFIAAMGLALDTEPNSGPRA